MRQSTTGTPFVEQSGIRVTSRTTKDFDVMLFYLTCQEFVSFCPVLHPKSWSCHPLILTRHTCCHTKTQQTEPSRCLVSVPTSIVPVSTSQVQTVSSIEPDMTHQLSSKNTMGATWFVYLHKHPWPTLLSQNPIYQHSPLEDPDALKLLLCEKMAHSKWHVPQVMICLTGQSTS